MSWEFLPKVRKRQNRHYGYPYIDLSYFPETNLPLATKTMVYVVFAASLLLWDRGPVWAAIFVQKCYQWLILRKRTHSVEEVLDGIFVVHELRCAVRLRISKILISARSHFDGNEKLVFILNRPLLLRKYFCSDGTAQRHYNAGCRSEILNKLSVCFCMVYINSLAQKTVFPLFSLLTVVCSASYASV